jgi:hypothetical protein
MTSTRRVIDDVRPSRLLTPETELGSARLVFTDDEVLVYVASEGGTRLQFRRKYLNREFPVTANQPYKINLEDGQAWHYWRISTAGCGCNDPLRNANVWADLQQEGSI